MLPFENYQFQNVIGIGNVSLKLNKEDKINVFIGNNGVGKTKTLESLYQALLFSSEEFALEYPHNLNDLMVFSECKLDGVSILNSKEYIMTSNLVRLHNFPIVFIPTQLRGGFSSLDRSISPLGDVNSRKNNYFQGVYNAMYNKKWVSDSLSIEEWFIQRALSSNKYQEDDDNREVELISLLNILNKIDSRIENKPESFSIPGGNSVSLTIEGKKRKLNELSSGFASLIKIIQSIISGYSFFTNATEIENIKGIVIIDEIESHLHISWQTKILPLLSTIFPNTYFIVATHSSLVLSQLYSGSAYRLEKIDNFVVNRKIDNPSNDAFVDLLTNAFDVNLNKINIENITEERYKHQKNALLSILQ